MKSMRGLCLYILLLISSMASAARKDSIYINQYVRNSFTQYGVRNALVTVMDDNGRIIELCVRCREAVGMMLRSGRCLFRVVPANFV